ncbi:DUF1643 domain-containing protein [Arcanobacterium pinnipediorum]|uniref:DUF1643 domain-containing protein n=1 Tax=Arcanobacterium pinnipediorum TaxID=1503041 RepID=A0ABY5AI83_9ACTO|nr:DUF1643 domain-containing protein [Arcanobacterium pinnipediorum]USR79914.1 DUF1643 domain-containing protein [Arcanobacterium pinnipediorum]
MHSWQKILQNQIQAPDPVRDSATGHAVFAKLAGGELADMELYDDVSDLTDPVKLRLLLTHKAGERNTGKHCVVIGMNPSTASAFQGEKADNTARQVYNWFAKASALEDYERLTMINLLPIIETESKKVSQLLDRNSDHYREIFHRTLDALLRTEKYDLERMLLICAWGSSSNNRWVRDGQAWFYEYLDAHEEIPRSNIQRLKYKSLGSQTCYPPHPRGSKALQNGNVLTEMPKQNPDRKSRR